MTAIDRPTRFPLFPSGQSPDELEREVLATWAREDLAAQTEEASADRPEFVFFEGPPTANGRPGIHHVLARTIKDLFCRYRVMKGFHVTRKAGWDTHGLPVEIEVEKRLGISGKQQIEAMGVEEFNRLCRESVFTYKEDWEKLSERIGYHLDYDDPYVTYSNEYIESVWWALTTLFEKGLLYRGHKILPYCARCGTALSSHEVAQGYEDIHDPSVYVALPLRDAGRGARDAGRGTRDAVDATSESRVPSAESRRILVWTTTPWTLVSNVALAVHPELEYVELKRRGRDEATLILAESRVRAVLGEDYADRWDVAGRMAGRDLVGMRYRRPLDWVPYPDGEHEIIVGEEFVSAEDGSGVVHMAPAFGADDYAAGQRHGLAFLQPVTGRGEFSAEIPLVGGKFVKDADPLLVEELKRRGVLYKAATIEHAYPHCWRCRTPLLYYAREGWFVRTTSFRDGMLARNARVEWHPPEMGAGRFGTWLENNIDWAISRDRYWGTPLPLWVCDRDRGHVEAVGSYARLAERAGLTELADGLRTTGRPPESFDPHRPFIDQYEWPCAQCGGTMRRVPEVIDAWFDSGSMPFAQWHFPFENHDVTARHYPADFIAEGVDQTRGWFYSMLAIATGLAEALPNNSADGAAPYRSVVVNDQMLDAQGLKMSKSRGNVVNPWEAVERHGADAVRVFLIASSQVWLPRRFDEEGIRELAGRFFLTLRNVYNGMFAQWANLEGWEPSALDPAPADRPLVDRWVLSRLATVARAADEQLERYEATTAVRAVMDFVVDDLSNWWLRLNRSRLYYLEGEDNRAAFATLHEVLTGVSRLLAPFAPFVSDWMHRQLVGTSVHLAPFAPAGDAFSDAVLEQAMRQVRQLATLARAAREEAKLRVRQPLPRMVCVVPEAHGDLLDALVPLLAAEVNIKKVEFAASGDALVRLEAKPNFRALGKRFGKRTPLAAEAVSSLSGDALAAFARGEEVAISVEGESHVLTAEELTLVRRATGDLVVAESGGFFAAIDPTVTPELRREGLARELVSQVQRMRKEAGLAVSDRIVLQIAGAEEVEATVAQAREYICSEVLAVDLRVGGEIAGSPSAVQTVDLDGLSVRVAITRES